jgi:hypothetical protein
MAEIQKMYGVVHGMDTRSLFGFESQQRLQINPQLVMELAGLPRGAKVGIEFHPGIIEPFQTTKGNIASYANTSTTWYWEDIQTLCHARNLPVVFLDSPELTRQAHNTFEEAAVIEEELIYIYDSVKYWAQRRKLFTTEVKAHMINIVSRERHILERIRQEQPNVVILGGTHGDVFDAQNMIQRYTGMNVNQYRREIHLDNAEFAHFVPFGTEAASLERRQLVRQYRAVSQARIEDSDHVPSHIGVFARGSSWTPEEGLFEIYPDESGRFSGTISDLNGNARFQGEITRTEVSFMKEYETNDCLPNTTENTITYQGVASGQSFKGLWNAGDNVQGSFVLIPYSRQMDLRARKQFLDESLTRNST